MKPSNRQLHDRHRSSVRSFVEPYVGGEIDLSMSGDDLWRGVTFGVGDDLLYGRIRRSVRDGRTVPQAWYYGISLRDESGPRSEKRLVLRNGLWRYMFTGFLDAHEERFVSCTLICCTVLRRLARRGEDVFKWVRKRNTTGEWAVYTDLRRLYAMDPDILVASRGLSWPRQLPARKKPKRGGSFDDFLNG